MVIMNSIAFTGACIFDGEALHTDSALLISQGLVSGIRRVDDLAAERQIRLSGGVISPGFVDLQTNGAAGMMLGDVSRVDDIKTICQAHRKLGTSGLLLTLISDSPANSRRILDLTRQAASAQISGFLGLHLEGPHLAERYKGAHSGQHIRAMQPQDCQWLCQAAASLPTLMITLAPEVSSPEHIQSLVQAGAIVSLGHSGADSQTTRAAFKAGAQSATHLFNAMRPLHHRDVGVVGAALINPDVYVGLIADGVHLAPEALQLVLHAKQDQGRVFLVSDAMATLASDLKQFHLHGRLVKQAQNSLQLEDGTLAGSVRSLPECLAYLRRVIGCPLEQALAMLTSNPARLIGRSEDIGTIKAGTRVGDLLHLDEDYQPTWLGDMASS